MLRANLQQIFRGTAKGPDFKSKGDFKIGKSMEAEKIRKNSIVIEKSQKDNSRELPIARRESSLNNARDKKQPAYHKEREDTKKSHRPPLPRVPKPDSKFDRVYCSKENLNGHSVNVRVNVQIVAGNPEEKPQADYGQPSRNPPRPPNHQSGKYAAATAVQTRLVKQKTNSQKSLGLPGVASKSSFFSNYRSDKSQEGQPAFDQSRKSLDNREPNHRKPDFVVRKMHTESSVIEVTNKQKSHRIQWLNGPRHQSKRDLHSPTDDLLVQHQNFVFSKRELGKIKVHQQPIKEKEFVYENSSSQKSTPNLLLKEQEEEIFGRNEICMFRRRNSEACLSSNSKNKIKYFLSDKVTRVLFEKVYKEEARGHDESSFLK